MAGFEVGSCVRLLYDVVSDGTVYGVKRGDPLVSAGEVGYVKRRGTFFDEVVYDVHFLEPDRIVGCREKELTAYDGAWRPARYRKGDRILAAVDLTHNGKSYVTAGTKGIICAVRYHPDHGYVFETRFEGAESLCIVKQELVEGV